ncbi:MAG: methyltransferase family protein, partial [Promethearchaeota archaeon]
MNLKGDKKKSKISSVATSISSMLIPFFQYVPCTTIWFGIMSVPLITYLVFFFQNPGILMSDLVFIFSSYEIYITLLGFLFYISSLIYQLTHRNQLIQTGPYKYVRHPQYIALIIMTFGMTLIVFRTSPIININLNLDVYTFMFLIWLGEVLAYIILAKIEDFALKAKYGDEFIDYANQVSLMFPFLKLK